MWETEFPVVEIVDPIFDGGQQKHAIVDEVTCKGILWHTVGVNSRLCP
jgi:hypothetical protein